MEFDFKNNFSRYLEALDADVFMKDAEGRYIFTNRPIRNGPSLELVLLANLIVMFSWTKIWPDNAAVRIWRFWPLARK